MGTSWYFCHTQIPILMTPVSFYQEKQSLFLGGSDAHFLELIKSCTESFMSETCPAPPAPWAGKDLSLWGNRYSGQYWVSRHPAQIVSLAPPPGLESSPVVLSHRQSPLSLLVLCSLAPLPNKKPLPWGCTSRSLGDKDWWRSRCPLRDFPCSSHSHLPAVPFLPSSLKSQTSGFNRLFLPFLRLGWVWQEEGNSSIGVERAWLHWSIFCPWIIKKSLRHKNYRWDTAWETNDIWIASKPNQVPIWDSERKLKMLIDWN